IPADTRIGVTRPHSSAAAALSHEGGSGAPGSISGSRVVSGRRPGTPRKIFNEFGSGDGPRRLTTNLRQRPLRPPELVASPSLGSSFLASKKAGRCAGRKSVSVRYSAPGWEDCFPITPGGDSGQPI